MIKKKPIQAGIDPMKNALNGVDLLQFVFFLPTANKAKIQ
jgi:hypothetical protein